jgi:hypothetical protein
MGSLTTQAPVKLISGIIFKDEGSLREAEMILRSHLGEIDFESDLLPFAYTDYYEKEFGGGLLRKFISFRKLIAGERLASIKILTNKIENRLAKNGLRLVNLDPGYLTLAKLVLASTKDYSHRIYLGKGIFAEITLVYQGNNFQPQSWTYPDYRSAEYKKIFLKIRQIYAGQLI